MVEYVPLFCTDTIFDMKKLWDNMGAVLSIKLITFVNIITSNFSQLIVSTINHSVKRGKTCEGLLYNVRQLKVIFLQCLETLF